MRPFVLLLVLTALAALAGTTAANPKVLPFSYGTTTVPPGELEIEQYVDIAPVRVARELPDGSSEAVTTSRYVLQTELELGITERLEVGVYTMFRQGASAETPALHFAGLKERLRYRVSDPATWPIGVGLYLELAQLSDELELEQKLLLDTRVGALTLQANLWIEQEWYWITDETRYLYNPTLGAAYELRPWITVGAEYWVRGRFDAPARAAGEADARARHFLGPTVMMQQGEYWMTVGAYARLDALGEAASVGDAYGKAYVRVIVGIGL